jgi:hypothetical protein
MQNDFFLSDSANSVCSCFAFVKVVFDCFSDISRHGAHDVKASSCSQQSAGNIFTADREDARMILHGVNVNVNVN